MNWEDWKKESMTYHSFLFGNIWTEQILFCICIDKQSCKTTLYNSVQLHHMGQHRAASVLALLKTEKLYVHTIGKLV